MKTLYKTENANETQIKICEKLIIRTLLQIQSGLDGIQLLFLISRYLSTKETISRELTALTI